MDDIYIERLILDVPGLTTGQAEELSGQVAKGLADARPGNGNFRSLLVELNDQPTDSDLPRLAAAIVESIVQQIG
jgi:hypothetical protein